MLRLGTIVKDKVVGIPGMLTTYNIDMEGNEQYVFQPSSINPETGVPTDVHWVVASRITGGVEIDKVLPVDVLSTQVEDKATGFKGTAVCLYYYMNGCIHFDVKPKGVLEKTKTSIDAQHFDLRRLKGKAIKELTPEEFEKSLTEEPSPERLPRKRN